VCDELVLCGRAVTSVTESTGCVIWQARQLVDRWACECHGHRGVVYQHQACRANSMRDRMSKICLRYGGDTGSVSDGLRATVYG